MRDMELTVYNVGQGLCTLYTGILDDGSPYCAIFDCGTVAHHPAYSKEFLLGLIFGKIGALKQIGLIVISHQDSDHWSMLFDILAKYFGMPDEFFFKRDRFRCEKKSDYIDLINRTGRLLRLKRMVTEETCEHDLEYTVSTEGGLGDFNFSIEFYDKYKTYHIEIKKNPCKNICIKVVETDLKGNSNSVPPLISSPVNTVQELCEIIKQLEKELIAYVAPFGITDIYFGFHVSHMVRCVLEQLFDYDDLEDILNDVPPIEPRDVSIRCVIWGGRKANAECRRGRELLKILGYERFIWNFFLEEDGAFVETNELYIDINKQMTYSGYDQDLEDCKGDGIGKLEIERNVSSAVVYLHMGDSARALLPGDLTVHAFTRLQTIIRDKGDCEETVFVAPHHGSKNTNFCGCEYDEEPLVQLLGELIRGENCGGVFISALVSKFGHPSRLFVSTAMAYCYNEGNPHVICFGNDSGYKFREWIEEDVYCTEEIGKPSINYPNDFMGASSHESVFLPPESGREKRRTPPKRCFL